MQRYQTYWLGSWSNMADLELPSGLCMIVHPHRKVINSSQQDTAVHMLRRTDLKDNLFIHVDMMTNCQNHELRIGTFYSLAKTLGIPVLFKANESLGSTILPCYQWHPSHCYELRDSHASKLRFDGNKLHKSVDVWLQVKYINLLKIASAKVDLNPLHLWVNKSAEVEDRINTNDLTASRIDNAQHTV